MSDIKYPFPSEVVLLIDEETKLVAEIASRLLLGGEKNFLKVAFELVDSVLELQQTRQQKRMDSEFRRRKGQWG